jgi:hypothetical protein
LGLGTIAGIITTEGGYGLIEKLASKLIRRSIRKVLLKVWDPIGIADEPRAQDEYDDYVGPVYDLLVNGANDQQVTEYLLHVVNELMGLEAAKAEDMKATVEALRAIVFVKSNRPPTA